MSAPGLRRGKRVLRFQANYSGNRAGVKVASLRFGLDLPLACGIELPNSAGLQIPPCGARPLRGRLPGPRFGRGPASRWRRRFNRGPDGTPLRTEKTFTIANKYGLHVRPCTKLSGLASSCKSRITLATADGRSADGESLLELLGLGILGGEAVTIVAVGDDAQEAMDAVAAMIDDQFGLRYDE